MTFEACTAVEIQSRLYYFWLWWYSFIHSFIHIP